MPFDITSKIFGAAIVALLISNVASCVSGDITINKIKKQLTDAKAKIDQQTATIGTLRSNATTLESSLKTCNENVQKTADVANSVAKAGVAALQQVQQAGKSVDRKVASIDKMPKETCEDAFNILKKP